MVRVFWYILHAALLQNEACQKHGVLFIADPSRQRLTQFDAAISQQFVTSITGALPVRMSGGHIVYPPSFFSIMWSVVKVIVPARIKQRLRIHGGSQKTVLDKLETKFGLTRDKLPTLVGGTVELDHVSWLETQKENGL